MKSKKKYLFALLIVIIIAILFIIYSQERDVHYQHKYANEENLSGDIEGIGRENTYLKYLQVYEGISYPDTDVSVTIKDYVKGNDVELLDNFEGETNVVSTSDESYVEWEVEVPQ